MTRTIIECAVKAANERQYTFDQAFESVIRVVEHETGYILGNQFLKDQILHEMSKYNWD